MKTAPVGTALEQKPSDQGSSCYRFSDCRFDSRAQVLERGGVEIALPRRATATLELLLQRHGELVERQVLEDHVWPGTFVSTASLTEAISMVRKALGDDPRAPRFVQTMHRRGYRFIARVSLVQSRLEERPVPIPRARVETSTPMARRRTLFAVLAAFFALARRVGIGG